MNEIPIMTQAQRIMYRDPVLVVLAAIELATQPGQPPARLPTLPAKNMAG